MKEANENMQAVFVVVALQTHDTQISGDIFGSFKVAKHAKQLENPFNYHKGREKRSVFHLCVMQCYAQINSLTVNSLFIRLKQ